MLGGLFNLLVLIYISPHCNKTFIWPKYPLILRKKPILFTNVFINRESKISTHMFPNSNVLALEFEDDACMDAEPNRICCL